MFADNTRNVGIINLVNSGDTNMLLYTEMAPPLLPNTSPVFSDTAVAVICQGDTSLILNNAYDADGDRLIYSFGTPYQGAPLGSTVFAPPPGSVLYAPGYTVNQPFGKNGFAALNATTGLSRYASPALGNFVVAVDVKEYRKLNGREVLVGTTRRDVQLVVRPCPSNLPPVFTPSSVAVKEYAIEEGQTVRFTVMASDPEQQKLTMKLNSALLDGAGPFNATFNNNPGTIATGSATGSASSTAVGTINGSFVYTAGCGDARATPYDVIITVTDDACGSKSIAEIYRIMVTKAAPLAPITGEASICDRSQPVTYATASSSTTGYQWLVSGGTLQGATTGNTVQVLWGTGPTGRVTVYKAQGCLADSVSKVVDLRPGNAVAVSPAASICPGASTTLTASGGQDYTWTGDGQTFRGATVTVSPTRTTTYTLTATTGNCTISRQVTVTVAPAPVANAGGNVALCPGSTTTLGTTALPGYSYQWSPAIGLSNTTSAQPTFRPPTGVAQTYTFTLTVTTATGCTATSSVQVTVQPPATVNAGSDRITCAAAQTQLGTAALPGYSYQWSPAIGLSSTTSAQPTLTPTNATSAPVVLTYAVLATAPTGCVAHDTVRITVNPRPIPDSIQGSQSVCPTVRGIVYSIRNPRAGAYQWEVRGGTISAGQGTSSILVDWGAATTAGSVRAVTLNTTGCASEAVVLPVRVHPQLATVTPSGPTQACLSDGVLTYQTPYTNGSVYGWQIVGGTQVSTNQGTVRVQWTRPGIGKLIVTEMSNPTGGICRGQSDTLYVRVLPTPATDLAISGPERVCAAVTTVSFSLPGAPTSRYEFRLNGMVLPGAAGMTITLPTPAASTTPYTLTAQETNSNGCQGPLYTKQLLVTPPLIITGPRFYCPEARTALTYTATTLPNGVYNWVVVGGTIVRGQGTATVQVDIPAGTTTATLQVTETTSASCTASLTVAPDNVQVALYTASVGPTDDHHTTLTFRVTNPVASTGQVRVVRRVAGSTGAFQPIASLPTTATTYTDPDVDADRNSYEYQLQLLNSCGTVLLSTPHTTILATATATESTGGRAVGTAQISWTAYQGFAVQEYRVYRATDNAPPELVATVPGNTLRTELATGAAGFSQCFRVQAVSGDAQPLLAYSNDACVAFENKLGFYNIITPNNDGKNDVLFIDNVALYPNNTLTVFDRWGKEVYRTTNYRNTYGGEGTSSGIHYYLFKLPDGTSYKGWFQIMY
ncbi:gliding motility-associated C-terminal domain-containing protein [Hymenobacter profundi]|uniref:Gliding motility-associated C-terminal domain-containing protein n=1 Tax=Hymenobacter profundi TaxID=1982110 RepID=A0ABS6WWC8_9BACT|nr:gliding motility-associated C-terminal domain-containing protein [Hymenobacter profundi]